MQLKLEGDSGGTDWRNLSTVFPEDVNRRQTFLVHGDHPLTELKLVFEESSDFFGRITLYVVQLDGCLVTAS
jgi:hypothetical protein